MEFLNNVLKKNFDIRDIEGFDGDHKSKSS